MTYVEILKARVAGGEITLGWAIAWLCGHGVKPVTATYLMGEK